MLNGLPVEVRWVIYIGLVIYGAGMTAAMTRKAVRALRLGERYVFAGWDGGALFRGRAAHPRWALLSAALTASVALVLGWGLVTGRWPKPDLVFDIPQGWLDVSTDSPPANYERLPPSLRVPVRDAARGVKRYAIDVDHLDAEKGTFPSFAAGYVHGEGVVTEARVRALVWKSLDPAVVPSSRITSFELRSFGAARMGRAVVEAEATGLRLYFYMFACGRTDALMSCTVPQEVTAAVEASCDAAAESSARQNAR